ncbi:MurR/RpiR family transcriptional regulator [Thermophilibacter immobilis]|uniref:MurR/RpiR family transcriptional regulator n=1 Tax=Thermophilibacter immobilis TaxID=2779519 RepID=A0A7S7M9G3_9ACTN|nr:MurR/RpiR family transcriptional regulator [Thermophilibacter immobilis]QOY60338.1 MurR/RpiR family transcriptional regulator [Thermophilibacter immobilis]
MSKKLGTIDTICAGYDTLSDTERRVADFILQNGGEIPRLSVREIAEGSQTSSATVSRFVRHAGYESFSALRLAIAEEQGVIEDDGSFPAATEISPDNAAGSIEYILATKIQELRGTALQLEPQLVNSVVDLIRWADTVEFAAVGNSIPLCSNLSFKLGQIGIRTICPPTTEAMILASLSLRRGDVLFVVSASGYSRRLETIVDNAEDSGATIVFVTSNPTSELAQRADVVLSAVSRDQMLAGSQFSSHISTDFVLETLFLFVFAGGGATHEHARMERKSLGKDKESTPTFS